MPSTFFGLNVAFTGLQAAQAEINTTANNISNVETKGYSKQVVNVVANSALRAYQKFGTTGTGVMAESVTQQRDIYYDEKYWNNQTQLGFYDKKSYYMTQIEDYYNETNKSSGFTTIYADMFNALDTLKTNAGDTSVRNQFISKSGELCNYFNSVSTQLKDLQISINDEIKTAVDGINSIAQKIALLNKQINIIEVEGGHANELRDQRALLVDELSEMVPVTAKEVDVKNSNYPDMQTGATRFTVKINGQLLVDNYDYKELKCVSREAKYNQDDVDGLYDIKWAKTDADFDCTSTDMGGSLRAMFEVRDGNNVNNMSGRVSAITDNSKITIMNPSIKNINELNMPDKGMVMVNAYELAYDGFEFKTDDKGEITEITFNMKNIIDPAIQTSFVGRTLDVGDSIDFMGIPYYQSQMNLFLRNFAEAFNDMQNQGQDLYGNDMESFFVAYDRPAKAEFGFAEDVDNRIDLNSTSDTYYRLTASSIRVADATVHDPRKLATVMKGIYDEGVDAHKLIDDMLSLENDKVLFRGGGGNTFLQCIYADVTVDAQECKVFTDNYTNIKSAISQQRQSISGVDQDEEALDLIKFQNAYNLASKAISVFTEIYDRLILNTGV